MLSLVVRQQINFDDFHFIHKYPSFLPFIRLFLQFIYAFTLFLPVVKWLYQAYSSFNSIYHLFCFINIINGVMCLFLMLILPVPAKHKGVIH